MNLDNTLTFKNITKVFNLMVNPLFPSKGGKTASFTLLLLFFTRCKRRKRMDDDIKQDQEHWPHAVKNWPSVFSQWRYLIINLS